MLPIELASLLIAAIVPTTFAQTFSKCKDNLPSCDPNPAQKQAVFNTKFGSGGTPPPGWKQAVCKGKTTYDSTNGAGLTVAGTGDCPSLEADNYFFFGQVDVKVKAAPGQGIVSSIVLESDALDEVDWEFIGGENYRVQSNYFGKGDTSTYDRMVYIPVSDPQNQWHTYTVNWTSAAITWLVDGTPLRTLTYNDAKGGTRFPQTPMKLKVGIWAGGDKAAGNGQGTIDWAGGEVDYAKGPFSMYVDSINIVNYSPADTYKYKDNSGSWQSIDVIGGSTGGQVSPDQVSAQQSAVASVTKSLDGIVTGSAVPIQALNTATEVGPGSAKFTTTTAGNSTFVAVATGTATPTFGNATLVPTRSAAKTSSSSTASASGNAASVNTVGLMGLGALLLALFL